MRVVVSSLVILTLLLAFSVGANAQVVLATVLGSVGTAAVADRDCLPYDPDRLTIRNDGEAGWLLTTGASRMLLLDNEEDALRALALARRHTHQCFIGRGNRRPSRISYIVRYWSGDSGKRTVIESEDCYSYRPEALRIVDEGSQGWLLTDGVARMVMLADEADAREALALGRRHSRQCSIGRGNRRDDRASYIVGYWNGGEDGACSVFSGYGRYALRIGCDSVVIEDQSYLVDRRGSELMIAGHTIGRGIYRKRRPWLYFHGVEGDTVDLTFEMGRKPHFPLYTGSSGAVFEPYAREWPLEGATNFSFADDYWLTSNRWSAEGVYFDLNQRLDGDDRRWRLVRGDILVQPEEAAVLSYETFGAKAHLTAFDRDGESALLRFESTRNCCVGDSPSCGCFDSTGSWQPRGSWIQDVALATLGANTSPACGVPAGGMAYYQMQLGLAGPAEADLHACTAGHVPAPQAWCSETISYWHREAGIPYERGYRNDTWLLNWQLPSTSAIRRFYQKDERGRWIGWDENASRWIPEMDYDNFRPGENAPLPGSYVMIGAVDQEICFYSAINYRGKELCLRGGELVENLAMKGLDKQISSVRFATEGFAVELFEDENREGAKLLLWGDDPDLRDNSSGGVSWNDRASSVRLERGMHSQLVDAITLYRSQDGRVLRAELSLLEGNSGNPPRVRNTRRIPDLVATVPGGSDFFTGRRILGFGIDLDAQGQPIYDRERLHEIKVRELATTLIIVPEPPGRSLKTPKIRLPLEVGVRAGQVSSLVEYAQLVRRSGGVSVRTAPLRRSRPRSPGPRVRPPGRSLDVIEIDLLAEHPLPILGVVVDSGKGLSAGDLQIHWAGANRRFQQANQVSAERVADSARSALRALFSATSSGVRVRYVKLTGPAGALPRDTLLDRVTFLYDWGTDDDALQDRPMPP